MSDFSLSSISSFFFCLNWQSRIIIICKFYLQSGFDTTDFWYGIFKVRCKIFQHHKHRNFWKISRVCFYEATIHLRRHFKLNKPVYLLFRTSLALSLHVADTKIQRFDVTLSRNQSETLDRQSVPFQTLIIFESIANQPLMSKKNAIVIIFYLI